MNLLLKSPLALGLCASLSACSLFEDDKDQKAGSAPAPKPVQTTLSPKEVETLKVDINTAMGEIPPELRNAFQSYFACEIKRDNSPVTGERIRKMTAALKANRGLANCQK